MSDMVEDLVVPTANLGDILHFSEISEPRMSRKRLYSLQEVLFLVLSGSLCGLTTWEEIEDFGATQLEWLRQYHPYAKGTPSHDTLNRVFSLINPREMEHFLVNWVNNLSVNLTGKSIHIDGKSIGGSVEKRLLNLPLEEGGKRLRHLVCAWSSELNLCIGQYQVDDKTNEIKAIPALLDLLDIKGSIVTIDAMGCQTNIVDKIVEKEADYTIALKGNQGNLQKSVVDFFENPSVDLIQKSTQYEKDHGRVEERICSIVDAKAVLPPKMLEKWTNLQTIIKIEARTTVISSKKETHEVRYYISSVVESPTWFNAHIRSHWNIENQLNWRLDVMWKEDKLAKRAKNTPQNFGLINRLALNITGFSKDKISVNRKQKKCLSSTGYRTDLLFNFFSQ